MTEYEGENLDTLSRGNFIFRTESMKVLRRLNTLCRMISIPSSLWEELQEDEIAMGKETLLIVDIDLGENFAERANSMRAAGCDALLVDLCRDESLLEPVISALDSKRSSSFGAIGLKLGYGTFASEQYWLNRDMKEILVSQRKRGEGRKS